VLATSLHKLFVGLCASAISIAALAGPGDAALVSRTEPEFPREAIRMGVEKGKVTARLSLDRTGEVTRVEILEAEPRRLFDRAVVKTLSQWRYTGGSDGRTVKVNIDFVLQ
jgi:protein TonB